MHEPQTHRKQELNKRDPISSNQSVLLSETSLRQTWTGMHWLPRASYLVSERNTIHTHQCQSPDESKIISFPEISCRSQSESSILSFPPLAGIALPKADMLCSAMKGGRRERERSGSFNRKRRFEFPYISARLCNGAPWIYATLLAHVRGEKGVGRLKERRIGSTGSTSSCNLPTLFSPPHPSLLAYLLQRVAREPTTEAVRCVRLSTSFPAKGEGLLSTQLESVLWHFCSTQHCWNAHSLLKRNKI